MQKLLFDQALQEITNLYIAAEPYYARHLSQEIFKLLCKTHELAFIFKGFPPEMASEIALEEASALANGTCNGLGFTRL
jgi:hypothetical protein